MHTLHSRQVLELRIILTSHLSYLLTMATITQISRPRMEKEPNTVATVTTILRSESSTYIKKYPTKVQSVYPISVRRHLLMWRDRGRVVKVPDLKSGVEGAGSSPAMATKLELFLGRP